MWIAYRDELGICEMGVDGTVAFADGFAWFSCEEWDFKIPIEDVIEIGNAE